jgi:hypothetical protein
LKKVLPFEEFCLYLHITLKHPLMTNSIILANKKDIHVSNFMSGYTAGKFRFITKCRAGFLTISDSRDFDNEHYMKHPETLISGFKKGALQTVQFNPEGTDIWLTVFAKKGKQIPVIDEAILMDLTVGTINSYWLNTALYDQRQYSLVGAKTWASKAFVKNEELVAA